MYICKLQATMPITRAHPSFRHIFCKDTTHETYIFSELSNLTMPNSELLARRVRFVTLKFVWTAYTYVYKHVYIGWQVGSWSTVLVYVYVYIQIYIQWGRGVVRGTLVERTRALLFRKRALYFRTRALYFRTNARSLRKRAVICIY